MNDCRVFEGILVHEFDGIRIIDVTMVIACVKRMGGCDPFGVGGLQCD